MSEEEISNDELFAQIAKNMQAMSGVIESHEAQIKRLQFRIDRLEGDRSAKMDPSLDQALNEGDGVYRP